MTISITSLFPGKNDDNIPVNSNINVEITSDSSELDVFSVEMYINDVQIQPSAYYGVDKNVVNIIFYSRRRIKYNNKRYGETDFRYGQTDIYPSAFQYGSRYVVTIKIKDGDGALLEENFAFNIEEGIFYNNKTIHYYNEQTQAVANYLPEWSKGRFDKYSNFQQLLNPSSAFLDQINDFLYRQISNYFLQTADLNEFSRTYKIELGGDYQFSTIVLDDGTSLQIPPEVIATKDITKYYPMAEFSNNIKEFYYNKIPTRLDEEKSFLSSFIFFDKSKVKSYKTIINKELERGGTLTIGIEGGTRFTEVRNNSFDIFTCRIVGISREGKDQIEDIVIIDNDIYNTIKTWQYIKSVQFLNIPSGSDMDFIITYGRPLGSYILDSFKSITLEDQEKPVFWKISSNDYGSVLQQFGLLKTEIEDVISSLAAKDLLKEYELVDTDNQTHLSLIDIDTGPFTRYIYGIDQDYLYIFDKRNEYSEIVKELPPNNGTAEFVLDIFTNSFAREPDNKLIEFTCLQKVIGKRIAQYRIRVLKPSGDICFLNLEGQVVLEDQAALLGSTINEELRTKTVKYFLEEPGQYVIYLETIYRDGSTDIDAKIVEVPVKPALAKYKLERLMNNNGVENIFVDFDQQLKIYDSKKELHTIRFAKDNVLIDYEDAVLMFNENYDEVEVVNG